MQVCPSTGRPCDCSDGQVINSSKDKQIVAELKHEKPPQEPIFPPELRKRHASELCLPGPLATWHRSALHVYMLSERIHASDLLSLYVPLSCTCWAPLQPGIGQPLTCISWLKYVDTLSESVRASELYLHGPLQLVATSLLPA